jgi:hypothetical protein
LLERGEVGLRRNLLEGRRSGHGWELIPQPGQPSDPLSSDATNHQRPVAGAVCPVAGTHAGATHWYPGLQSLFVWHGQAQRPTWVLQRCDKQVASVWQGNAIGAGVDIPPVPEGAGCAGDCP